jgi:ABC-type transport system involved in multi-copper enzyme maturation permease subunit
MQWTGGTLVTPAWLKFKGKQGSATGNRSTGPIRALIQKELRSHAISLLMAVVLLVIHVCVSALRRKQPGTGHWQDLLYGLGAFIWVLWFGVPILIGCSSISEERKLGTLETQFCLAITRRTQFFVKLGVALFLGTLFGGCMPSLIEGLAATMGLPTELPGWQQSGWMASVGFCCALAAVLVLVSFYASSFTRNVLQACSAAVVAGCGFAAVAFLGMEKSYGGLFTFFMTHPVVILWRGPLMFWIAGPSLLLVVFGLAFHNFKRLQIGWDLWIRNLVAVLGALGLVILTTILVWNRIWESALNFEPRHGPPQLRGPVEAKTCSVGDVPLVLLPDGRMWAATTFRPTALKGPSEDSRDYYLPVPVPTSGKFLESSNWIDLAGGSMGAAGIRSDGSLWRIGGAWRLGRISTNSGNSEQRFPPMKMERVGDDGTWKQAVYGAGCFLALKRDGTLWGWGINQYGQLGPGPKTVTNLFGRVSLDSDWAAIYASGSTVTGVKRDGSVWKWGYLPFHPWANDHSKPEPVPWSLNSGSLRWFCGNDQMYLFIRDDGSLWSSGYFPYSLFGTVYDRTYFSPKHVGHDSWSRINIFNNVVVGLKLNGKLVETDISIPGFRFWGNGFLLSKYADWITVSTTSDWTIQALSSDGTLSCWDPLESQIHYKRLLGPTHRPLWSINIFAVSE